MRWCWWRRATKRGPSNTRGSKSSNSSLRDDTTFEKIVPQSDITVKRSGRASKEDIKAIQGIGRKSVNRFTGAEIAKNEKYIETARAEGRLMIDKESSMQGIPQVRYPGNINMKLSPDTNVSSPIGESNSDIKDSSSTDFVPITAEEAREQQKAVTQLKADMGYDAATREEILDRLKGYKLYLAKEYSADVDGLTEFRKKHFGKLNVVTTVYGRKT